MRSQEEGRTEEPSGGVLAKARREGRVAISSELSVAAGLGAGFLALILGAPAAFREAELMLEGFWGAISAARAPGSLDEAFARGFGHFCRLAALPLLASVAGIIVSGFVQTGFRVFPSALKPDFRRLGGRRGIGGRSGESGPGRLYRTLFPLLRAASLLLVCAAILPSGMRSLLDGAGRGQREVFSGILDLAKNMGLGCVSILLAFGLADIFVRRSLLFDSLRLTPSQLNEERRNEGGDPRQKAAIRRRMQASTTIGAVAKTGERERG